MPTRTIQLTDYLNNFIEAGIESGRFGDASEAVREGLRLLEQREEEDRAKREWLKRAAKEGFDAIDRGDFIPLTSDEDVSRLMMDIHDEAVAELGAERRSA